MTQFSQTSSPLPLQTDAGLEEQSRIRRASSPHGARGAEGLITVLRELLFAELRAQQLASLSVEQAAARLGLSGRTLQRRLGDARITFTQLRHEVRFHEACRLMQHSDRRLADIACDLGFSDHAHFTRAFRGWTGLAPKQFRRLVRSG